MRGRAGRGVHLLLRTLVRWVLWRLQLARDHRQEGVQGRGLRSGDLRRVPVPLQRPTDEFGQFDPHPKYADPNDCAKFYVCLNGISPREQGCELGLVYNELTKQCDAPENVPECKDYYAFLDEDVDDAKRRK